MVCNLLINSYNLLLNWKIESPELPTLEELLTNHFLKSKDKKGKAKNISLIDSCKGIFYFTSETGY